MILLLLAYTNQQNYQDPNTPQAYGSTYDEDCYEFDEVNETVTHTHNFYDDFQNHNAPQDFSVAGAFYDVCAGTTQRVFVHDGFGGFTVEEEADSISCGFVPASPPSCDLTLSYQLTATAAGGNVVATAASGHGTVRYSLDGSPPQLSPAFNNLAPGRHVLRATDAGVMNCSCSVAFTVLTPPPPAAPAGPVAGIDFVLQPLWYSAAAPAGAEVVLELYAESQHRAEDFALVMRLRKRADALGRVGFRLDTLLAPLVRPMVPPRSAVATVVCRTPLLNYFVRTATLLATGQPASYVTSAVRTALRGGLPPERRDIDYFTYRVDAYGQPPFLSWQPANKRITAVQPEWLFWLCTGQELPLLKVRRSYVRTGFAGDLPLVEEETIDLRAGRGPLGQLLAIPVRPRTGMDSVSIDLVSSADAGANLSPHVTFRIIAATEHTRYLQFTNSLGGFDTLRTEGRLEGALEGTADRYELPALPVAGPAPAAERQVFAVMAVRKLKLATGWLTAAQLAWLQELVLACEIWEWKAGRLLPIDPSKRQLAYLSDENPLRGMLLEFDYAYDVSAYANLP